jgi:uncharacterized Tic20 family protein
MSGTPATPVSTLPSVETQLSPSEERTWAMLAHLSVLINLVTGMLGPIVALIIYLVYKNRSRYVAYQAMQSFLIQLIGWVLSGFIIAIVWIITAILMTVLVGFCLVPFAALLSLLPMATVVYACVAAYECSQSRDFSYWLIGDWVRGTYTGS